MTADCGGRTPAAGSDEDSSRELATAAATVCYDDLPAAVITAAEWGILDTVGVALAATGTPSEYLAPVQGFLASPASPGSVPAPRSAGGYHSSTPCCGSEPLPTRSTSETLAALRISELATTVGGMGVTFPRVETRTTIALRIRDIDVLGHVDQMVLHEYLGEARVRQFGSLPDFSFAVAHVQMDFRAEVTLDREYVDVVMRTASIGNSSFTISHEIVLPDGTVAAEGHTVLVAWDRVNRCAQRLTPEQRTFLTG